MTIGVPTSLRSGIRTSTIRTDVQNTFRAEEDERRVARRGFAYAKVENGYMEK